MARIPTARGTPGRGAVRPTLESLLLFALVGLAVAAGHQGSRFWQVLMLAMPALVWLWFPLRRASWRLLRAVVVSLWSASFIVDGAVRNFLYRIHGAMPDSGVVMAAVANTHPAEAAEFFQMYGRQLIPCLLIAALALVAVVGLSFRSGRARSPLAFGGRVPSALVVLVMVLGLASVLGLVSKPWRRWHPVVFWPGWIERVAELRQGWSDQDQTRSKALAAAAAAGAVRRSDQPSTVVLVIADSVNRDNMQLYGYPRVTTPGLETRRQRLGEQFLVLGDAWSTEPGTLGALQEMFEADLDEDAVAPLHLLALARAAGYEIWWISNHDDLAIEQLHGGFAHERRMANHDPGRGATSLDQRVLRPLDEALDDPSPHKLIVVHLLGAHPDYRRRFPQGMPGFDGKDIVDAEMAAEDRPWWLRRRRAEYDTAILFHDRVVSDTLDATIAHLPGGGRGAWMYLSDHGQEVGHDIDHAGHSSSTAAGYKIPALIWQSHGPRTSAPPGGMRAGSFRSDWAAWTLGGLLGVHWQDYCPTRDVLSPEYEWRSPPVSQRFADVPERR